MFQRTTLISVMLTCFFSVLPIWAEMLPSGTELVIQLEKGFQRESKSNEKFRASLTFPVFIDGREVVPVGSKIEGDVRGTKKAIFLSPRHLIFPDGRRVDFNATVSEIDHKRLEAEQMEGVIEEKGSTGEAMQQAGRIGVTGAGIGIMTTGTAKGAAIGAVAGVGAVLIGRKIAGRNRTTVIPAGTQLTLQLTRPLEIPDNMVGAKSPVSEDPFNNRDDRRPILRR